jgi:N12 class adenine-specific DNA methylase
MLLYPTCVTNITFSRRSSTSGSSSSFENGASAFVRDTGRQKRAEEQRIQQLEDKLRRKHEVLSELMEEHIKLKKELGEL